MSKLFQGRRAILAFLLTAFTLVEWENNPFPLVIRNVAWRPDALENLCKPRNHGQTSMF